MLALVWAPAAQASLPSVASGHRPGPDALYAPPPSAPQLDNRGVWKADPILVSGAQAYRRGEWLYQDFLYDDHGAAGVPDLRNPYGPEAHLYSPTAGTYAYPLDPAFAHNAADLVELRIRPLDDATAFRVTLNTLQDAERTAFTIALGDSDAAREWPHSAGVSSPATHFLTVHGSRAELIDAATGAAAAPAPSARLDLARRQVEVRVPRAAWDPGSGVQRVTIGVGLWDPEAGSYLAPKPGDASETRPGGGNPQGTAIVNVGPRFEEPWPDVDAPVAPYTLADSAAGAAVQGAWWRERAQADALRLGDVSTFRAEVDFGKLAAKTDDDSAVPKTGPINRILASRHEFGQGLDPSKVCFDIGAGFNAGAECIGRQVGQLQPYTVYVPDKPAPEGGFGLTLLLHSLSANHNQYSNSRNQSQLGDRGAGTIVATPAGRGPDGFYAGIAEADTFEVWADVARHYPLDADWSSVTGYSMGGFGTYRLLARWPDLFARGFSVVGVPGSVLDQLPSLRNHELLAWNAVADELVNIAEAEEAAEALEAAGVRFDYWQFPTADHLTLATNDEYGPGAEFLGEHRVDRDPPHVTFVVDEREDSAAAATVSDHAYWLSGMNARDGGATGTVDARSEAFGVEDAEALGVEPGGGALTGGSHGPMPYVSRKQEWGPAPATPAADRLTLDARNVSAVTVDARRARLSCAPLIELESDGPLALQVTCASAPSRKRARVAAARTRCARRLTLRLPRVAGRRVTAATVLRGARVLRRARGANIRRLAVRRPGRGRLTLRVRMTTVGASGPPVALTLVQRVPRC